MYGKWVTVEVDDIIHLEVFVTCTPNTSDEELQKRARKILRSRLGVDTRAEAWPPPPAPWEKEKALLSLLGLE